MGSKVSPPTKQQHPDAGADDLEVLHPERTVTIAGRQVTVREYGFVEGLRLMPLLDPLINEIRAILERADPLPGGEQIPAFLGNHADALPQLIATVADVEPEWVAGLSLHDGHELTWWWWIVNGPFCVRNAGQRAAVARAASAAAQRAGQMFTPPSSPAATEPPAISAD